MKKYLSIILILIFYGCHSESIRPKINTEINIEELPTQESWNSEIVYTDSGKVKAIIKTGHIRVFSEAMETLLDSGLQVDFYNPNEEKSTTLTSKRGRVNDNTKDIYAIENVVAISDSGVTLMSEELMWRNKDKKIYTDKFVTIITRDEKIQGYGFESDQHLRNYTIYKITYVTRNDIVR